MGAVCPRYKNTLDLQYCRQHEGCGSDFRQTELCNTSMCICVYKQQCRPGLQWRRPLTCALQPACQLVVTDDVVQLGVVVGLIPAVLKILPVEMGEVHYTLPVVDGAEADDARRRRTLEQVCDRTERQWAVEGGQLSTHLSGE